jgi:hypothetical protein
MQAAEDEMNDDATSGIGDAEPAEPMAVSEVQP